MKKLFRLLTFLLGKLVLLLKIIFRFLVHCVRAIHRKKRYAIPFYTVVAYILLVVVIIMIAGDSDFDRVIPDRRVNDVTQLNPIQVGRQVQPQSIEEIVEAIRSTTGPISIGGGRFSMGGQIGYENSLHIDMRKFNRVLDLDTKNKQVTVQAGIVWRDVQRVIDPHNLSIKIMQTYANFTVGGSVSVNCHGRYIGHGPIVSSVKQLKIVTASGEVITASRTENPDVFASAVGGYGGIGVIAEVTLQLADNVKVERRVAEVLPAEYNSYFDSNIRSDSNVIFQNGDLYPPYFETINSVSWVRTDKPLTDTVRVTPEGENYWLEHFAMDIVSSGRVGKWLRRNLADPLVYNDERVVWRNREASYDVQELEPDSREEETYVLQEYFIPVRNLQSFIPKMKAVFDKYDVNVINVSIRHAYADEETYLSWAPEEVFAFVIYYQQGTDQDARSEVRDWTVEMTDAILSERGRWYLPYQPHASAAQFRRGYIDAGKYFDVKNRLDPMQRFTNKLLDKYNPYVSGGIDKHRADIKGYYRDEAQSFLTVPEWYLVFNPKEYADFLEAGNNPSDFPFYASIDEYWSLYDRSLKLVSEAYPANDEYKTMLDVIGVSITMEYTGKMLYENTVGRVFSWFSNGTASDEEKTIIAAQRAYSDFIYDKAWYEFKFLPWIKRVWTTENNAESNWLRKVERMLFFTAEFTFKAVYAKMIEWGAKASYEEPVTEIYMIATVRDSLRATAPVKIVYSWGTEKILSITRWGEFTKAILDIRNENIAIHEIGGNDEILVSVLAKKGQRTQLPGELLYASRMVTDESEDRLVYLVRVKELLRFVREAEQRHEVEHIFDY